MERAVWLIKKKKKNSQRCFATTGTLSYSLLPRLLGLFTGLFTFILLLHRHMSDIKEHICIFCLTCFVVVSSLSDFGAELRVRSSVDAFDGD